MSNSTLFRGISYLVCMCGLCVPRVTLAAEMPSEVLSGIVARQTRLQNMRLTFTVQESQIPIIDQEHADKAQGLGEGKSIRVLGGDFQFQNTWTILGDRVRYEQTSLNEPAKTQKLLGPKHITSIYDDRMETLSLPSNSNARGMITAESKYPDVIVDVAFGLRLHKAPLLLSKDDVRTFEVEAGDNGNVVLRRTEKRKEHVIELSPSYGYAPVKYTVLHNGKPNVEYIMEGFERVGEVWYPKQTTRRTVVTWNGKDAVETDRRVIQVEDIAISPADNVPEAYPIVFPNGTELYDARLDEVFNVVSGDQALSDDKLFRAVGRGDNRSRGWIIAMNVAVAAFIVAAVIYRRRRAKHSVRG